MSFLILTFVRVVSTVKAVMTELPRFASYLKTFRAAFEPVLKTHLDECVARLGKIDPVGALFARLVRDFTVRGGKRIRPALVSLGYEAAAGRSDIRILRPAVAIELLHSFLLIHDDIIDRSATRRGRPTVHRAFLKRYAKLVHQLPPGEQEHIGNALALMTGDACCALTSDTLARSGFPAERLLPALRKLQSLVVDTAIGEALDVIKPFDLKTSAGNVLNIHVLKTARYTFEGPLHIGMFLGGADEAAMRAMSSYAVPVGIAFQIQDDILGVFGSAQELGKSVTSDLEEGKQTLLTVYARRHATSSQQKRIRLLLGRKPLDMGELAEIRSIMRGSGALGYAQRRSRQLVSRGKRALQRLSLPAHISAILEDLANYLVDRTT